MQKLPVYFLHGWRLSGGKTYTWAQIWNSGIWFQMQREIHNRHNLEVEYRC